MRTVVLGAGALGSIFAAHLARAGQDVSLIARGPRAKLLAERGVTVSGLADFTAQVPIVERPAELDACDVFVITAKTYDTQPALEGVRGLKAGMAISVQNGVVKDEHLAATFGAEHTAGCVADFSGEVREDDTVLFTRNEGLYVGELPQGTSPRIEKLAQIVNEAGINTIASDRIQSIEWSKYTGWMGLTAVAVLSRLDTYRFLADEDLGVLLTELTREAVALSTALGIEVTDFGELMRSKTLSEASTDACLDELRGISAAFEAKGTTGHRMSALQDLLRGRHLEIEETFGYAVTKSAEIGVPVPRLDACYRLLAAVNRNAGT